MARQPKRKYGMEGACILVRKVEQREIEDGNPDEDSQEVLERFKEMDGVGLRSSSPIRVPSPRRHLDIRSSLFGKCCVPSNPTTPADPTGQFSTAENEIDTAPQMMSENGVSYTQMGVASKTKTIVHLSLSENASPQLHSASSNERRPLKTVLEHARCASPQAQNHDADEDGDGLKMDPSQSPTQFNDDRSYPASNCNEYFDTPSDGLAPTQACAPAREPSPRRTANDFPSDDTQLVGDYEPMSLRDDDAGAVNFDSIPLPLPGVSPIKHRDHTRNSSGDCHGDPTATDDTHSDDNRDAPEPASDAAGLNPVTPAPHNPFAGMKPNGVMLDTSQMFQQTQATSAIKPFQNFSPTSSRPSPDLRAPNTISPNIGLFTTPRTGAFTSPLKGRNMRASTQALASSPPVASSMPRTTSTARPRADTRPSSRDDEARIPESPLGRNATPPPETRCCGKDVNGSRELMPPPGKENGKPWGSDGENAATTAGTGIDVEKDLSDNDATKAYNIPSPQDAMSSTAVRKNTRLRLNRSETVASHLPRADDITKTRLSKSAAHIPHRRSQRGNAAFVSGESQSSSSQELDMIVEDSQKSLKKPRRTPSSFTCLPDGSPHRDLQNVIKDTPPMIQKRPSSLRSNERVPETSPVVQPTTSTVEEDDEFRATASRHHLITLLSASESGDATATDGVSGTEKRVMHSAYPKESSSLGVSVDDASGTPSSSDIPLAAQIRTKSYRADRKESPETPSNTARATFKPQKNVAELRRRKHKARSSKSTSSASSSPLSEISHTPQLSEKVTPSTQASPSSLPLASDQSHTSPPCQASSPRVIEDLPDLPSPDNARPHRQARKPTIVESDSMDELARLTPVRSETRTPPSHGRGKKSVVIHKPITYRSNRGRKSAGTAQGNIEPRERSVTSGSHHLFQGMAFAISFQSRRTGEAEKKYQQRMHESDHVSRAIVGHGGRILERGFDELFEVPSLQSLASPGSTPTGTPATSQHPSIRLKESSKGYGFVALIADGHSRKAKYMQALALGLPCISDRWIAMCIKKGEVVAWDSYLLCAGNSSVLGDAIRSRHLMSYSALGSKFSSVINRRNKLLEGQSILLVMRKSQRKEEQKKAYIFLAQVLGATLTRAETVAEAREKMRERELSGGSYDWVYYEGEGMEEGLFGNAAAAATATTTVVPRAAAGRSFRAGRKRKRHIAREEGDESTPAPDGPAPKRVKALSDEIVVQSLILGRLVEDEELELCKAP